MQECQNNEKITKQCLLLNYLNFGDFELFRVLVEELLQTEKNIMKEICKMVMRRAKNSSFPDIRSKVHDTNFSSRLYSYILKIMREHFLGEIDELEVKHFEDLVEFDFLICTIKRKIQDINFNHRVFQDIRQKIFQKESLQDVYNIKSQEEYVENIGALKYVYLKFPEEAVALYKIINRYQIQDPQDYSMSYIYSVIKDILWSALNERQLETIYTYISLLSSNNIFLANGFIEKFYEEFIANLKTRNEKKIQGLESEQYDLIAILEGLLHDSSLTAIRNFESYILKTRYISEKSGVFDKFKQNLIETQQNALPTQFWESLTVFAFSNKINPLMLVISFLLKCFNNQEFEYIELIMQEMTNVQDLILLIIANNISQDNIEIYCNLLEKIRSIKLQNSQGNNSLDPAIVKLEHISQELQFQIFLMKQLFLRTAKTGARSTGGFSQFYSKNHSNTRNVLQGVIEEVDDLHAIIKAVSEFEVDESNAKLREKKKRTIDVLSIILVKWNIYEEIRYIILSDKGLPNALSPNTLDLIFRTIDGLQHQEEIVNLIDMLKQLTLSKYGDTNLLNSSDKSSAILAKSSLDGPSLLNIFTNALQKLVLKLKQKGIAYKGNEYMQKWFIRNELFTRLLRKDLFVHEYMDTFLQKTDTDTQKNGKFSAEGVRSLQYADFQEIYFGNPISLLKYVILLKDKDFLRNFCTVFHLGDHIYKSCKGLIDSQSQDFQKQLDLNATDKDDKHLTAIDYLLLQNCLSSIQNETQHNTENMAKFMHKYANSLLSTQVFQSFPELRRLNDDKIIDKQMKENNFEIIQGNETQLGDLSLSFRREIESLFDNKFEEPNNQNSSNPSNFETKLNYCVRILTQYESKYRYLHSFILYVEKIYRSLKDSLQKIDEKGSLPYSIEYLCSKLLTTTTSEQFISFVGTLDMNGPELAANLAQRLNIDIFSAMFLPQEAQMSDLMHTLDLSLKFEWFLKEEFSRSLKFLPFSEAPFSTMLCLVQNENPNSTTKLSTHMFDLLQQKLPACKDSNQNALMRYFQSLCTKEPKKSLKRKQKNDKENEDSTQRKGYMTSSSKNNKRIGSNVQTDSKGLLSLMLIGSMAETKKKERDKIASNIITTKALDLTFDKIDVSNLLKEFKIQDIDSAEDKLEPFNLDLSPKTSNGLDLSEFSKAKSTSNNNSPLSASKEQVTKSQPKDLKDILNLDYNRFQNRVSSSYKKVTVDTLMDSYLTVLEMDSLISASSLPKAKIEKYVKQMLHLSTSKLNNSTLNKSILNILRRDFEKIEFLNKKYGPFQLKPNIPSYSLVLDLYGLCLEYNVPLSYKHNITEDLNPFIDYIEKKIINFGHSRKLSILYQNKGDNIALISTKKFKMLISLSHFKEARIIAEKLMEGTANLKDQHSLLEFILKTFEDCHYENSLAYINRKQDKQLLRHTNISPLPYVEAELANESDQFSSKVQIECLYYLNKYGTPEKQVLFYERNNQYEQAYKIAIFKGVSKSFFAERVVKNAYEKNKLTELRHIITRMDPELRYSLDYLGVVIDFLKQHDVQNELNHFQVLVGDFFSLGSCCIEQFKASKALKERIKYLQDAEAHFKTFLEKPYLVKLSAHTEKEAKDMLHKIRIQREIIREYPEFIQYHVFGTEDLTYTLCEKIMSSNPQFAFVLVDALDVNPNIVAARLFNELMQEHNDINNVQKRLICVLEIKSRALANQQDKGQLFDWDDNFLQLGLKLRANNFEFVKTKLAPLISSEQVRMQLLNESAKS